MVTLPSTSLITPAVETACLHFHFFAKLHLHRKSNISQRELKIKWCCFKFPPGCKNSKATFSKRGCVKWSNMNVICHSFSVWIQFWKLVKKKKTSITKEENCFLWPQLCHILLLRLGYLQLWFKNISIGRQMFLNWPIRVYIKKRFQQKHPNYNILFSLLECMPFTWPDSRFFNATSTSNVSVHQGDQHTKRGHDQLD